MPLVHQLPRLHLPLQHARLLQLLLSLLQPRESRRSLFLFQTVRRLLELRLSYSLCHHLRLRSHHRLQLTSRLQLSLFLQDKLLQDELLQLRRHRRFRVHRRFRLHPRPYILALLR